MPSVHRVNAIIAYKNGDVSNYTSAADGQQQIISKSDPEVVEAQLFSWPSFREFMASINANLTPPVNISSVLDIAWSVDMEDETGRRVVSGFEAKGGPGSTSNTTYDPTVFPTVEEAIGDNVLSGDTAVATATMIPNSAVVVARGSGYNSSSVLSLVGGVNTDVAEFNIASFSSVLGQTEADFTAGELTGVITPGTGHVASDEITLSDGTIVRVDSVGGSGDVTGLTIIGVTTTGFANFATISQSSTTGSGVGFALTMDDSNQGVFAVTHVSMSGDYTSLPSNPVSTTVSTTGSGCTLTVDWSVLEVTVVDGGSGYASAPAVSFLGGSGTVAIATIVDGEVTSISVTMAGSGYTSLATVIIDPPV